MNENLEYKPSDALEEFNKSSLILSDTLTSLIENSSYCKIQYSPESAIVGILSSNLQQNKSTETFNYCVWELFESSQPKNVSQSTSFTSLDSASSFLNSSLFDLFLLRKSQNLLSHTDILRLEHSSELIPEYVPKDNLIEALFCKIGKTEIIGAKYKSSHSLFVKGEESSTPEKTTYTSECSYESFNLDNFANSQFNREALRVAADYVLKENISSRPVKFF